MGFLADIRSLFVDDYKEGVQAASQYPAIFVDSDALGRAEYFKTGEIPEDSLDKLKQIFRDQIPDISDEDVNNLTRSDVRSFLEKGPAAAAIEYNGQKYCIAVEQPSDLDYKTEFLPVIAKKNMEQLKEIPGWSDHWDYGIGVHEGTHCNQDLFANRSTLETLKFEIGADQAKINWLNSEGHKEMAQALKDYRSLSLTSGHVDGLNLAADPSHAVGLFVKAHDEDTALPIEVLEDAILYDNASYDMRDEISKQLQETKGLSEDQVKFMRRYETEDYINNVEALIDNGNLKNDNPYFEDFARDYLKHMKDGNYQSSWYKQSDLTKAMEGFEEELYQKTGAVLGVSKYDAQNLSIEDPEAFEKAVKTAINNGDFKADNPFTDDIARQYMDAYRRQIIETEIKPKHGKRDGLSSTDHAPQNNRDNIDTNDIKGGEATVDLYADTGAKMQIGGVDASSYFASVADPQLAQQRIDSKAAATAEVSSDYAAPSQVQAEQSSAPTPA